MRPRFMNRGSVDLVPDVPAPMQASMRPRFMNRGSAKCWSGICLGSPCFNEAPIHESGKSSSPCRAMCRAAPLQ